MEITQALARLLAKGTLSEEESRAVFSALLDGRLEPAQIGALLALIQSRGVTVDELTGAARVMREKVTPIPAGPDDGVPILDTCGTGGAPKTFNVSTAAAIVAAAAGAGGVRVAKHGNRSRTGRGSAEVLAALGVDVDASPEIQARCLREVGVCFCFAIRHHPAARHAAPARMALKFPTVFNVLGPLTNPAGATRQLLGIYDRSLVEPVAGVLATLGAERAWVVHSEDGLDEIAISAPTFVAEVSGGSVSTRTIDAREHGIERASLADLQADSVEHAADIIRAIFAGEPGPKRDFVLINAAAALLISGCVDSLGAGLNAAREAIDSGHAGRTLEALARVSHGAD
ncbi:MAG: anthranilate phosphoribosyltransferase [Phycisphaerales bacterium JB037]